MIGPTPGAVRDRTRGGPRRGRAPRLAHGARCRPRFCPCFWARMPGTPVADCPVVTTNRQIALLLTFLATTTPLLGGVPDEEEGDDIVDVGELRALEVVVSRDGDGGSYYPRRLTVVISLPWPKRECPVLHPAMTVTLNGQPSPTGLYRG